MADITEGMKVKRMRYFDGLFLTQEEFNLEQNYHIRMRRLHNRHLHTWGIVWGLDVVADGNDRVKIKKGIALNKAKGKGDEGNEDEDISQEIVLTEDSTPLVLESKDIKDGVYIYLDLEKVENHIVAERGGTEEIHWLENAVIGHTTNINDINENEGKLILAKVINDDGIVDQNSIKYFKDNNEPLRTYAGAYGNLTLPVEKENPYEAETSIKPAINGKKINGENGISVDSPETEFTGSVEIAGDLNVTGTADGNLADNIVDTDQIKDNAVTAAKIASGSVGNSELADNAVTSAKIADGSVGTAELADNAVTAAKIADGSVGTAELADNAVTAAKIADGSVSTAELADNAVTAAKIADGSVSTAELADNAVTAEKIASGSVGTPELADNAVTAAKIASGSVGTAELADNAVTAAKIADGSVGTAELADNAVTETKLEQAVRDKLATVVSPELVQEIEDARGIKSTLGNRLDESLTKGGQLRSNVVGEDQLDVSIKGKLVTNGDSHDHSDGDGATIRHSSLNKDDGSNPHSTTASDVRALALSGGTLSGNLQVNGSIGTTGSVGIGTKSPSTILHISNANSTPIVKIEGMLNTSGEGAKLRWTEFYPTDWGIEAFYDSDRDSLIFRNIENNNVKLDNILVINRIQGRVGIGIAPAASLDVVGDIKFTGNLIGGGKGGYVMDKFVNKVGETLEQGDVVVIGENQTSLYYGPDNNIPVPEVDLAQRAYDTSACGIVCEVYTELMVESGGEENPAGKVKIPKEIKVAKRQVKRGSVHPQAFTPEELAKLDRTKVEPGQIGWMVTLGAYAHCKVDADIAPIEIGDLLTTSPTKGHAQKVIEREKAVGAIIGKALGSLRKGKGKIPVLVTLH